MFAYTFYITKWEKGNKVITLQQSLRCFVFETIQKPKTLITFWCGHHKLGWVGEKQKASSLFILLKTQSYTSIEFTSTLKSHLINSLPSFLFSFFFFLFPSHFHKFLLWHVVHIEFKIVGKIPIRYVDMV